MLQANKPATKPVPVTGINVLPAPVLGEGDAAVLEFVAELWRLPTC